VVVVLVTKARARIGNIDNNHHAKIVMIHHLFQKTLELMTASTNNRDICEETVATTAAAHTTTQLFWRNGVSGGMESL
jgi:hypothetical protein